MSVALYLEHLSDADLALLAALGGNGSADDLLRQLHSYPESLDDLLTRPAVYASLFEGGEREALLRASPFLVFAVLVHRAARDLAEVRFVDEWVGPGRRVPMFEVAALRDFTAEPARRLFLAELLASYTHVASGSIWVQTARGWRRRRFSELDPLRLIEMAQMAPERERPVIYRRLGDLALFLTGVFPDYAGRRFLRPIQRQRLERILQRDDVASLVPGEGLSDIGLLEAIGRRAYRVAWRATEGYPAGTRGVSDVLADLAEEFGQARRALNFLTDRYMFPRREEWFPFGDG